MRPSCFFLVSSLIVLFFISACSSGSGSTAPCMITDDQFAMDFGIDGLPVGVTTSDYNGNPVDGFGVVGLFSVYANADELTADLTPLRKAALPDVLEMVDITNFLSLAPCTDCVKIFSMELDSDESLVLNIGIKHPFEEGDPFKPITGRNRGDLHVFNVEGLVISDGTETVMFPGLGKTVGQSGLVNADGYSPYLAPVLGNIYPTEADIFPYILHFDDYSSGNFDPNNPMGFASVTDPPPNGNLVMAMGSDYDIKPYKFAIDNEISFILAIGCTYAVSSATKSERFNPEFRVPQHLKKAASEVWVEIVENNLAGEDTESSATLHISVVDINHGVPVGDGLDEMLADSSVSGVTVEVPGVTAGGISFSTTPINGTGRDPDDPLIFEGEITNAAGGDEGSYLGLVKITDSYPSGLNESPLLGGQDGIERVDPIVNPLEGLFAIPEFATYQVFSIDIETVNEPPVAIAVIVSQTYDDGTAAVMFDASASYDPDGIITDYAWDFNNDGLFDDVGDEYEGDPWSPTHNFTLEDYHTVQLRVTDNRGATTILENPITFYPFKNMVLREDVTISDVATIMDTDEVLVLFEDHEVWKYNNDLNEGALHYTMPGEDTIGRRIAASKNGDSICGWWNDEKYHTYSYYYDGTLAQDHDHAWLENVRPPYNIDLMVSYMDVTGPNGGPGLHHVVGMWIDISEQPTWIRYGYNPPEYYFIYSNYNTNLGPGPGRIDIQYLKGVQALSSQQTYGIFYLEGEPEWRVERSHILLMFSGGWGGTQTDDISGFYNPQDITSCSEDRIYVLDILSTGQRVIKKFSTTGTPFGMFGDNEKMASDPDRLDGSFASDWLYVTMNTDRISIFFPSEHP